MARRGSATHKSGVARHVCAIGYESDAAAGGCYGKIEASPTILANQWLFVSGVIVSRGDERFIFADLGNRVYRA